MTAERAWQAGYNAELSDQIKSLETRPTVQQLPARYDDTKLWGHLNSVENLALECYDEVEKLGTKTEADIRQLRQDLLRVAGRLQQAELKSKPWYTGLLFWRRRK